MQCARDAPTRSNGRGLAIAGYADRRFTQNMTRIVSRQKRPEITEIVIPYWRARCMEGLREAHPQAIVARPACWD